MIIFNYSLICLIFGTTFLAIRIGVDASVPPFFSAGLRFLAAGAILFLFMIWRGKANWRLLWRKEFAIIGACMTFGTFSALYWAEQFVESGIAAVLSATGPLIILVLQALVLRQRPSRITAIGCLVGFTGIVLIMLPSLTLSSGTKWLIGCAAILVGELAYSVGTLYSKPVTQRYSKESPIAHNAVQMMYGGLLLLLLSAFTEHVRAESLFTWKGLGPLFYLIVIGSMVGHSLFYWLVSKTNPVFPSTWLYVSPIIALAIGALFYGESLTWLSLAGVLTVIIGTILANASSLGPLLRKRTAALYEARDF